MKSFIGAKTRLGGLLSPAERARLAQAMAERTLMACRPWPVTVVCDDREVAKWAEAHGAVPAWMPGPGLNAAVTKGVQMLADQGYKWVTVLHADLPLLSGISQMIDTGIGDATGGIVVIAPDRHRSGTNAITIPASSGFGFSYGVGSFQRHCIEAHRVGLEVLVLDDHEISHDIDSPEDLWALDSQLVATMCAPCTDLFERRP